jgi:ATP-binding cassette, subfamily B, bacterial PglK
MLETYRKLLDLLTPSERRRFYLLLVMILIMGVVQMVSVASILPFLGVLANPGIIETSDKLSAIYHGLGFTSQHAFLMFLGGAVFVVLVVGLLFKTATQYAIYRFATMRGYSVSKRLLQGYLRQPYTWFLNRHSADLGANILTDVSKVIGHALMPAMKLLSHAAVVLFLVALLVAVQPMAALVLACLLGGSYGLIYLTVRRRLARIGAERYAANQGRFQTANEAMGGIKEVKIMGLEEALLRRFKGPAKRLAECDAQSAVIGEVPRYILEAVAFGSMLMFILAMLATGDGSLENILPVLGIYAFAGLRLFPALQQVYASMTTLRFSRPTLDKLHQDVMENDANAAPWETGAGMLHLARRLELQGVRYAYPNAERAALDGLDMAIDARTTVGIVGGTGAGKTTAVDIVLGLLRPQQGTLRVDGLEIGPNNLRAWQNAIGYVPQQIFLTDDTVRANIAFGLPAEAIDDAAVERAARVAELHDFVTQELPRGYETTVGERGVRLSGGQRQRIGIARALYHDPDVLILDEATSALDNLTERAVMDAVHNLGHAKTIILIAHRLSTVRSCDAIFMLEHGRVVARGTYDELLDSSQKFRAMAAGA